MRQLNLPPNVTLPISLYVATSNTDPLACPANKLTHSRRVEIINNKKYIEAKIYSERYKTTDIRSSLQIIYKGKCGYCEQNARPMHVEHFRPKSTYYWLTYSWDNLLLACASCNSHKLNKFMIRGTLATFSGNDYSIIHNLNKTYCKLESPLLLHPITDNIKGIFTFEIDGKITSKNRRGIYTIKTCDLNRKSLCDDRRKIVQRLRRDLNSIARKFRTEDKRLEQAAVLTGQLVDGIKEKEEEFIAFRIHLLKNSLESIMNEVFNSKEHLIKA